MTTTRYVRRRMPTSPPADLPRSARRVRSQASNEIDFKQAKASLSLDAVIALQAEAADIATRLQSAEAQLLADMKAAKLVEFGSGGYTASIERAAGRSTNTVDPAKFRKLVKDDAEFFGAISVSMTEAKKLLPEKTLKTITHTVAGKPGEEKVKVTLVKVKVK